MIAGRCWAVPGAVSAGGSHANLMIAQVRHWQPLCDAKDQNARNVMRRMILAAGLVVAALATPAAKAEDFSNGGRPAA